MSLHRKWRKYRVHGITYDQLMRSSGRNSSMIVGIGFGNPIVQTKRAAKPAFGWPENMQLAWDLAH
jgi:hypothetical protein